MGYTEMPLEQQVDMLRKDSGHYQHKCMDLKAQLAARDAEVARLREALGAIRMNARLGYGAAVDGGNMGLAGVLSSIETSALLGCLDQALGQGGAQAEPGPGEGGRDAD